MSTTALNPLFNFDELSPKSSNRGLFANTDILSVSQFDKEKLAYIFQRG